jgi:hypothetical protein
LPRNRKEQREKQAETDRKTGGRALAATKKPADEQRRATDRTNPRLGFQPSPILRAKASERKKRSRYPRDDTYQGPIPSLRSRNMLRKSFAEIDA